MIARSALVFPWLAPQIPSMQIMPKVSKDFIADSGPAGSPARLISALACWTRDTNAAPAKLAGTTGLGEVVRRRRQLRQPYCWG